VRLAESEAMQFSFVFKSILTISLKGTSHAKKTSRHEAVATVVRKRNRQRSGQPREAAEEVVTWVFINPRRNDQQGRSGLRSRAHRA